MEDKISKQIDNIKFSKSFSASVHLAVGDNFRLLEKSPIIIPKLTGQPSGTIYTENIVKMYQAAMRNGIQSGLWLISIDLYAVGIDESGSFHSNITIGPKLEHDTLFDYPIVKCWDLPDRGELFDIILVDLNKFVNNEPCSIVLGERK